MDLTSRLRSIVRPGGSAPRELTYEPDTGRYEATIDLDRVADVLGGRVESNRFGRALIVERRYESDRWHGTRRVSDCYLDDGETLRLLDPSLPPPDGAGDRTLFVDLETTGLSGGAGTVAFLVGCGWFDMGAFQIRQFLLTSYANERALLDAVATCFDAASLLVTYNGKTFDVPVMETRWMFHRMRMPLESVRHFDMLHPARRLWRAREPDGHARSMDADAGGCRLSTLERVLCEVTRVGDVPGMEIPGRYFKFVRTGDARPLEPVLEHNRLDLISLAAVSAHAVQLVEAGHERCRDACEVLALGKVYERAGSSERALECYRRVADDPTCGVDLTGEALYRLGIRLRRDRRYREAADCWRRIVALPSRRSTMLLTSLRKYAVEALAIHHEHRERDYEGAKELTLQLLEESEEWPRRAVTNNPSRGDATRHRLARLEKKIARGRGESLFGEGRV